LYSNQLLLQQYESNLEIYYVPYYSKIGVFGLRPLNGGCGGLLSAFESGDFIVRCWCVQVHPMGISEAFNVAGLLFLRLIPRVCVDRQYLAPGFVASYY